MQSIINLGTIRQGVLYELPLRFMDLPDEAELMLRGALSSMADEDGAGPGLMLRVSSPLLGSLYLPLRLRFGVDERFYNVYAHVEQTRSTDPIRLIHRDQALCYDNHVLLTDELLDAWCGHRPNVARAMLHDQADRKSVV